MSEAIYGFVSDCLAKAVGDDSQVMLPYVSTVLKKGGELAREERAVLYADELKDVVKGGAIDGFLQDVIRYIDEHEERGLWYSTGSAPGDDTDNSPKELEDDKPDDKQTLKRQREESPGQEDPEDEHKAKVRATETQASGTPNQRRDRFQQGNESDSDNDEQDRQPQRQSQPPPQQQQQPQQQHQQPPPVPPPPPPLQQQQQFNPIGGKGSHKGWHKGTHPQGMSFGGKGAKGMAGGLFAHQPGGFPVPGIGPGFPMGQPNVLDSLSSISSSLGLNLDPLGLGSVLGNLTTPMPPPPPGPPLPGKPDLAALVSQLQPQSQQPPLNLQSALQGLLSQQQQQHPQQQLPVQMPQLPRMYPGQQKGPQMMDSRHEMANQLRQMKNRDSAVQSRRHQKMMQRLASILVVCKVVQHLNKENILRTFFEKFGKISVVLCSTERNKAYVVFSKPSECAAARDSPEAILGNRFIALYPCGMADLEDLAKIPLKPFQLPGRSSQGQNNSRTSELKEIRDRKTQEREEVLAKLEAGGLEDDGETLRRAAATLAEEIRQLDAQVASAVKEAAEGPADAQVKKPWWTNRGANRSLDTRCRRIKVATSDAAALPADLCDRDYYSSSFGDTTAFSLSDPPSTLEVEFSQRWQAEKCLAHLATIDSLKADFVRK